MQCQQPKPIADKKLTVIIYLTVCQNDFTHSHIWIAIP